jgi:hypothetical protein
LWRVQAIDKSVSYDVEISYRGLRFSAPDAKLRLGQWRGRELRDITTAIDPARSTIIGRGSGPGVFAILETQPR